MVCGAFFSLFFLRTGIRSTIVPLFASNNLSLDSSIIGLVLTIGGIASTITMIPSGIVSDKIGRRTPIILSFLLASLAIAIIPFSSNLTQLILTFVIYGFATGLSGPISAYIADVSDRNYMEVSMGFYRMVGDMGFVLGPLTLGITADLTSTPSSIGEFPFFLASIFTLLSILFLVRAKDPVTLKRKISIVEE
jgi:MFS family permease